MNFSRIIGGGKLYPNFSYIGLNTEIVVDDPTETKIIGNMPFVTPKYDINYNVQQFKIGDIIGGKPDNPIIRIAFRAVVGSPTANDVVTFFVIVSGAGFTSYQDFVANDVNYIWDIGTDYNLSLDPFSDISLLVSHPDNLTIEIYPYSLTMVYQQVPKI